MSWIDGLRERVRPLFDRAGLEAEMDEEMAFHFEREVESNLAAGMDAREARRAAHASMGGPVRPAGDVWRIWKGYGVGGLGHEFRLAFRRLRRRPGFTLVATLTLALGIGANTAIFSLVRSVLIRPLPYAEPERLALIWNEDEAKETWLSARELVEFRRSLDGFESLSAYTDFEMSLTGDTDPERVLAAAVTVDVFETLGVRALHGRLFVPEDDVPAGAGVALLSHDLWQRRYGGDPGMIGRTIEANGQPTEVIGVLEPGFRLPLDYRLERPTDVFVPSGIDETQTLAWGNRAWFIFGRLEPGVSAAAATSAVRAVNSRWIDEGFIDADYGAMRRAAVHVDDLLLADMRTPLLILMGAVGFILLIACANVAHLLLARAEARRGEVAVAAAMGASRGRLARQYLVENGILATVGAALGVGLATVGVRAAVAFSPVGLIRMRGVEVDGAVLAFAALLAIATTLIAGLAPALRLTGVPLTDALGRTRGAARAGGRTSVRRGLVAVESALAVILVIGAALLGRSFAELSRVDVGFESSNVLTAGINVPAASYPEVDQVNTLIRDLGDRVGRLPGVEAAGAVRLVPLRESIGSWTITLEEPITDLPGDVEPDWQIVTPGYFDVMRIELREGRFLTDEDRAGGRLVAMISGAMADRYWPGESAVGKRFHLGTANQPWVEIVGIAADVRHNDVLEAPRTEMYLPHEQWPEIQGGGGARRTMTLVVRTQGDPMAALPSVRRTLGEIDASIPLADPQPMAAIEGNALAEQRFTAGVFGLFAGLALLLAAIGLYGVTAYTTSRRTNELGIRMALGAGALDVARMVVREAILIAGVGVLAGAVAAAWLTRFIASQLYGVSPLDAGTFVAVPLALLVVAAVAAYVPARRAAKIDPALALRSEA